MHFKHVCLLTLGCQAFFYFFLFKLFTEKLSQIWVHCDLGLHEKHAREINMQVIFNRTNT